MESTGQTFMAVGASVLTALLTFVAFSFPPLFLDSLQSYPSTLALLAVPVAAFLITFLFLLLSQTTKAKEKQLSVASCATAAATVPAITAISLFTVFIIPWLRNIIGSAVPNLYAFTPEQLLLQTKLAPDTVEIESTLRNQKQSILDNGASYAYFAFWGSLFGNILIFGNA
jgi:hypothetical protein